MGEKRKSTRGLPASASKSARSVEDVCEVLDPVAGDCRLSRELRRCLRRTLRAQARRAARPSSLSRPRSRSHRTHVRARGRGAAWLPRRLLPRGHRGDASPPRTVDRRALTSSFSVRSSQRSRRGSRAAAGPFDAPLELDQRPRRRIPPGLTENGPGAVAQVEGETSICVTDWSAVRSSVSGRRQVVDAARSRRTSPGGARDPPEANASSSRGLRTSPPRGRSARPWSQAEVEDVCASWSRQS